MNTDREAFIQTWNSISNVFKKKNTIYNKISLCYSILKLNYRVYKETLIELL